MTFEQYMKKNFAHFDLAKGELTVNAGWLKYFWLAAIISDKTLDEDTTKQQDSNERTSN